MIPAKIVVAIPKRTALYASGCRPCVRMYFVTVMFSDQMTTVSSSRPSVELNRRRMLRPYPSY